MIKLSVVEAAGTLGISKEAVYNRIRRNTLQSVTEDGVKYVILNSKDEASAKKTTQKQPRAKKDDDKYEKYLLEQIGELKTHVNKLENDKEQLIKEKENILVESRRELERIYEQRDKQLKQILSIVTRPILNLVKKSDSIDAEFEDLTPYERGLVLKPKEEKWVNLEEYMNEKGYSYKKKKSVNQAILAQVGENEDIKEENGFLFIKRGKKIKQILKGK